MEICDGKLENGYQNSEIEAQKSENEGQRPENGVKNLQTDAEGLVEEPGTGNGGGISREARPSA